MKFSELLNDYMNILQCTGKELSDLSGISASVISRYRNGEREPQVDSDTLVSLSKALATIALSRNRDDFSEKAIYSSFEKALRSKVEDYENFIRNFQTLYEILNLNMKELSAYTNFDTSFLYRIKSGERKIADLYVFCEKLTNYIVSSYYSFEHKEKLAVLMQKSIYDISTKQKYYDAVYHWLLSDGNAVSSSQYKVHPTVNISQFLKKMNEFDLEDYIKVIHFDELKVPTIPFELPSTKVYNGVKRMRKGEIDFFKATVTSKNAKSILMCANMPMTDLAEDNGFNKKWMFAIACSIKKGLHLDMVHYLERPFEELLLGLEAWIPIYMTGQVSPWYLPNYKAHIFHHLDYISEAAVLHGECIEGAHEEGRYILTNNKEELSYYQKRAQKILTHAAPLMEIYDYKKKAEFQEFLQKDVLSSEDRQNILSSLPIYSISEGLLDRILATNRIPEQDAQLIRNFRKSEVKRMEEKLKHSTITDEISIPSKETHTEYPMLLSVSGCFYETPILYSYDDMLAHISETKRYAECHENYTFKTNGNTAFRNIQIEILKDKYITISKIKSPSIHFVIKHPRLIEALQNFTIPVTE